MIHTCHNLEKRARHKRYEIDRRLVGVGFRAIAKRQRSEASLFLGITLHSDTATPCRQIDNINIPFKFKNTYNSEVVNGST